MDIESGDIRIAAWKYPLAGDEAYPNAIPSNDIFSTIRAGRWRAVADSLVDSVEDVSVASLSSETNPQFEVVLDRRQATTFGGYYPETRTDFYYSFINMTVDIHPV